MKLLRVFFFLSSMLAFVYGDVFMVRPFKNRCTRGEPVAFYFKPQGVPLRALNEVVLYCDEFEALKLHDVDNLNQTDSAKEMKISQSTFARILDRAYKKVAKAIVSGMAIRIEK